MRWQGCAERAIDKRLDDQGGIDRSERPFRTAGGPKSEMALRRSGLLPDGHRPFSRNGVSRTDREKLSKCSVLSAPPF